MRGPATSKPKKADVEALEFLHNDLDPTKGEDLETERAEILSRLLAFSPAPSAIIDSGGGYQAFWRLDEPFRLDGDPTLIADAEAYSRQLAIMLGGDHCHNVDRLMRLPGTVNLPNAKKREEGRVASVARVVRMSDATYALAEFAPAPCDQPAET